jgi:hypothetical protein
MLWPSVTRRFPVLARRDFRLLLADRLIAPGAFAWVSAYDALGSMMAMPVGGPGRRPGRRRHRRAPGSVRGRGGHPRRLRRHTHPA